MKNKGFLNAVKMIYAAKRIDLAEYTLITGGSSGIGFELAKIFSQNQHHLILAAKNPEKLERAKNELESQFKTHIEIIAIDLTTDNAAQSLYNEVKKRNLTVDILVNDAGFGDHGGFLDSNWNRQKDMININVLTLMQLTYLFGNEMRRRGFGRILNVSSVAALGPGPYMSIYYASKAFVLSFSQAVSEELKGSGVTVSAICLGPTATGFETAAGLKGSNSVMFSFFKPAKAADVAKTAYKGLMSGETVIMHGMPTKLMNFGTRLVSKRLIRKFAAKINGDSKN